MSPRPSSPGVMLPAVLCLVLAAAPPVTAAAPAQPQATPVPATPVETPGPAVAQQVAAIGAALHAGDLATARAQLDGLAASLPARSLTLLRMQAWYAHASGDSAGATALYRDIVARLPGDVTAAINLAILEAANDQSESARQRLRHLRARDIDAARVEQAIERVEAQLR